MGEYSKWIYIVVSYVFAVSAIYIVHNRLKANHEKRINKSSSINRHSTKNRLYLFYRLFRVMPGINKIFAKVIASTESVYPADVMSVNKEATKIMLRTSGISAGIAMVTLLVSQGDVWYILMGLTGAIVIFYQNVHTTFAKKEYILLIQLKDALSAIRHHYLNDMIVEDAIEDSLDEVPFEIGLHLSRINEILISPTIDEDTEEYTEMSPNRFLLLMLSICSSTKEYNNGETGFLKSLAYLKEELGQEILKKKRIKASFSSMQGVSICVIFFLKPIEIWAKTNMPETQEFYTGTGRVMMIIIFLIAFACFYMIDVLKESRRGEIVRYNMWNRISAIPWFSTVLNKVVNKKYLHYLKLNEDMKEVGDQTGPKAFLTKQCVFALTAFVLMNSTVFITTVQHKLTMISDYVAEFDKEIIPNERFRNTMAQAAQEYVIRYKHENLGEEDVDRLVTDICSSGTLSNEVYARLVAEEVIRELKEYKNTYYKWYMLLMSMVVAVIAFYIPKWYLRFRIKVSDMNKEEEVNQFHTLILILMHADGIQLDEILEWMNKFAYSFKSSIEECILNLENGIQNALEKMKDSESNTSFQRFVDCLLMIDDTDIRTAFSEIEIDRAYAMSDRQQVIEETVKKRSVVGKFIALCPIMCAIFGYLFAPIALLAYKMYTEMNIAIG